MKITYIALSKIPSLTANSVHVMKVCQALTQLGHSAALVVPGSRPVAWSDLSEQYGVTSQFDIKWLPASNSLRKLDFFWGAVRLAKNNHSDLIYTRSMWAALLALLRKVPVIFEMHDIPAGRFARGSYRTYLRLPGERLSVFITHALQKEVERRFSVTHPLSESIVAPDGVDLERYQNLPTAPAARKFLGLPEKITAVYTGAFYAGRGLEILLELASLHPEVQFIWIGGDEKIVLEWKEKIKAAGLTNIVLTGFVLNQQLPKWQAAADILLMPYGKKVATSSGGDTASVASPMKLFEYMACGRAILSSDLPVLHEVIDTSNALFFPPDDLPGLDSAFSRLLQDEKLRTALGDQALRDVTKYSWKNRMRTILAHFSTQIMEQK
ncbi:MAG: glycosyltransferase family 4 protein [Anaerolineaceae bacterium]